METIIVEINIPAITSSFDFRLPSEGRVSDIVEEIIRILEVTQQNLTLDKEHPMLCDLENSRVLDPDLCIAETGIHDSSRLLLL